MKLLLIGDVHIRTNTPRSRTDNIVEVLRYKFKQLTEIVNDKSVEAVICTGDIFDIAKTNNESLLLAKELFDGLGVPVYTIIGNHDMIGNSIKNHEMSSLNILEMIAYDFNIINMGNNILKDEVQLIPRHYGDKSYSTSINGLVIDNVYKLLVSHTMVVDAPTMFESVSTKEVFDETDADFVLVGHNHKKFYQRWVNKDMKDCVVYNPGALLRLTIAEGDYNREVEVGLLDTCTNNLERLILNSNNSFKIDEIEEMTEVISRTLTSFMDVQMSNIRTVEDILLEIAHINNIPENIVNKALQKLKKH